jgi:hypothetical protein
MTVTWLLPVGALASIALAAIVLLHMRHRLPKVQPFPQLAFWPRVPSESRDAPRWRRPPLSLLLALQLLVALLLVLAFMRPALAGFDVFGGDRITAVQHIVVVDGSTSMLARADGSGTLWDVAREDAETLLDDWQQGDGVSLVIAGASPLVRSAADRRQLDELQDWLQGLVLPGGTPDLPAVSSIIADIAVPGMRQQLTLVTDGGLSLPEAANGKTVSVESGDNGRAENVAITSTSVGPIENSVRLVETTIMKSGTGAETYPWIARVDGTDVDSGTVTLAGDAPARIDIAVPAAASEVLIEVGTADPLPADNRAYLSFAGGGLVGLNVVLVSDVPGPSRRALQSLPGAQVDTFPSTTPGITEVAARADLVVYESTAPRSDDLPQTPILLIQPSGFGDAWQVGGVVPNPTVSDVALDDPAVRDLTLDGVVFGETPIYAIESGAEIVVSGQDGDATVPLVWRGILDGQPYVAYAFDPAQSSIASRVTFPVLVAQTVFSLVSQSSGGVYAPGETVSVAVGDDVTLMRVERPNGTTFEVPVAAVTSNEKQASFTPGAEPGIWSLVLMDGDGAELTRGEISVNAGNPVESRLSQMSPVQLAVAGSDSTPATQGSVSAETFAEIWPLLVLAALVITSLEWIVWVAGSARRRRVRRAGSS